MPDHIHLFVRLSPDLSLAQWVRTLKRSISGSILEHAPHWQEGFFDHLLRGKDSYAQKWEYVRQNPVRAGLAASTGYIKVRSCVCRLIDVVEAVVSTACPVNRLSQNERG